ncbi:MAG: L,D-transpeptidase [Candidatus Gastranaerophilaceae bacterium]
MIKKIILILLILIMTAAASFAEDFSDDAKGDNLPDKLSQINLIRDDEQKVKAWAKFSSTEYYVIIDKKDCSAIVYDKEGNEINRFEIGIGRDIGDDFNDTRGILGKPKNTTPAGEYTLIPNTFNKSAYGDLTLSLGAKANKSQDTKKVVALHKVPKFRQKDRISKFYDGDLANNRMSHGCINFIEEDFEEFKKYIHGGLKTYILPEEKDNRLTLTKNNKGEFELTQTKYPAK